MLKKISRWLFIQTHNEELVQVKKYVNQKKEMFESKITDLDLVGAYDKGKYSGQALGALDVLEMLNLFISKKA